MWKEPPWIKNVPNLPTNSLDKFTTKTNDKILNIPNISDNLTSLVKTTPILRKFLLLKTKFPNQSGKSSTKETVFNKNIVSFVGTIQDIII